MLNTVCLTVQLFRDKEAHVLRLLNARMGRAA